MPEITIHPVAIDMEELVTAVARLLCLSKLAQSERDKEGYTRCAAEFTSILGLDPSRVKAKADEILNHAKSAAKAQMATRWN